MNRGEAIESAMQIPGRAHMPTREEMECLWDLAKTIKASYPMVVEVGSWFGRSAWVLAYAVGPSGFVRCVDPCVPQSVGNATLYERTMQRLHLEALVKSFTDDDEAAVVSLVIDFSPDNAGEFPDDALDMVWLDGDHSFDTVSQEIDAWSAKLKRGGILCGHDYGETMCPDVKKAVDESGLDFSLCGSVWSARV